MSSLSAFEAGIVGCASWGSCSGCIRASLSMSLPMPVLIGSAGSVQIHWNGLVGHPPRCIGGIKLGSSLSSTLGTEAWATLLVEEVPLSSLVATEEPWSSTLKGLVWLVHGLLEVAASSIEASGVGSSPGFKDAFDQHPRLSDFDGLVFEPSVIHWDGGYKYGFHDVGWESFDEQMEYFIVSLGVAGIATEFFESGDVVIDLWEFHVAIFELSSSSVFFLGVLILFCEFVQELVPHVRDVVMDWI